MKYTAEAVTKFHVDKIADQISDAVLDYCLYQDPNSRVAIETILGHGHVYLVGEITTKAEINPAKVARGYLGKLGYKKYIKVRSAIVKQSPNIAQGVNKGGAGDQGVMIGYACNENDQHLPNELVLSREILKPFQTDGKSQITIENEKVTDVVLSVQGKTQVELQTYLQTFPLFKKSRLYCNNTGSFEIGGFDADSGCTGRKIVIDAYGPRVPVGGGAWSGKDSTKVDRSGAYMARFMALDLLKNYEMDEVIVKLAYVIGGTEPIMKEAILISNGVISNTSHLISLDMYDCRPQAIIERFNLRQPIYLDLAKNGHFGRKGLPWEK